jgi:hypothetical protein
MKQFTRANIICQSEYVRKIECNKEDLSINPLWFHKKNLSQTATGYGKALKSEYMIRFENRNYRVLCSLFSNSGTYYFKTKNVDIILNIY